MPLTLNGTTGQVFPTWTTAGRPASPSTGQTGFNTTLGVLEFYGGSFWEPIVAADNNGDVGIGIAPDGTQVLHVAAGSTSKCAIELNSGSLMTTVDAGSVEYDGTNFYFAANVTEGRGFVPATQMFKLTSAGSNIGNTISNFFGTNSNIPLVANGLYEIEIAMFFVKGSTAGAVTWTLTNSAAPTSQAITYEMSPVTGVVAPPGTATLLVGHAYNNTTAAYTVTTASLTASVNHYARFKIFLVNGSGTSLKIQATVGTGNNNITPGIGSYWKCTRLPATNTGAYAA